jgi:hypothetical protein
MVAFNYLSGVSEMFDISPTPNSLHTPTITSPEQRALGKFNIFFERSIDRIAA